MRSRCKVALCTLMLVSGVISFGGSACAFDNRQNEGAPVAERILTQKEARNLIDANGHAEIPYGITSIDNLAFYGCEELKSVTIPNSVKSIGYHAFTGCYWLMEITVPDSVTSIGCGAFRGCPWERIDVYSGRVAQLVFDSTACHWNDLGIIRIIPNHD